MPAHRSLTTFVIEPNGKLNFPYGHLPSNYKVVQLATIELALWELANLKPNLVFLSASFPSSKLVKFLEAFKNFCRFELIPLVIIVDLSHRLNFIPGISWGGKIAVLDSFASKRELLSTISRVLKS
jgi:hypothetical protein